MIREDMTYEEKMEEARRVQRLLGNNYIAGGYLRDIHHGGHVKDIDVWVPMEGRSREALEHIAAGLLSRVGQFLDRTEVVSEYGDSSDIMVFKSEGASEDVEPVDIIFYRGMPRWQAVVSRFDFGICKYILDTRGNLHTPDESELTTAYINSDMAASRVAEHAMRIHRKYPLWKPRFNHTNTLAMAALRACHSLGLYNGASNGNTGEILSAQAQGPSGNTLRQSSREEAIRRMYNALSSYRASPLSSTTGVSTGLYNGGWTTSASVHRS